MKCPHCNEDKLLMTDRRAASKPFTSQPINTLLSYNKNYKDEGEPELYLSEEV